MSDELLALPPPKPEIVEGELLGPDPHSFQAMPKNVTPGVQHRDFGDGLTADFDEKGVTFHFDGAARTRDLIDSLEYGGLIFRQRRR